MQGVFSKCIKFQKPYNVIAIPSAVLSNDVCLQAFVKQQP